MDLDMIQITVQCCYRQTFAHHLNLLFLDVYLKYSPLLLSLKSSGYGEEVAEASSLAIFAVRDAGKRSKLQKPNTAN